MPTHPSARREQREVDLSCARASTRVIRDRAGDIKRVDRWTVDQIICDPDTDRAVIEWTHEKTKAGVVLRGDEWYHFDPDSGLIAEIRAYYASPQATGLDRLELAGYPYAERGYAASE